LGCEAEIGVRGDDYRRGVAELEIDAFPRSALSQLPADRAGARERDRLDTLVVDQHVTDLRCGPCEDAQPAGGEPCLLLELREQESRERRLARRLQHDRAARGERRCELVRDEI